ncbi:MAG: UbiX family flavin prenyltransferase [Leptospirillia bacterium]
MSTFVIGITGASGAIYGVRLIEALARGKNYTLHVVISRTGRTIIKDEVGLDLGTTSGEAEKALVEHTGGGANIQVHGDNDLYAGIASGSFQTDGMVVAPCSMKTVASIAHGYADTLIARAADVHIKECRPLIVVPRETPLSPIHLENLLTLSRLEQVRVVPATPAFYHHPKQINELVDFVVARILDSLAVECNWAPRWTGRSEGG